MKYVVLSYADQKSKAETNMATFSYVAYLLLSFPIFFLTLSEWC